jgi:hypothetical protein
VKTGELFELLVGRFHTPTSFADAPTDFAALMAWADRRLDAGSTELGEAAEVDSALVALVLELRGAEAFVEVRVRGTALELLSRRRRADPVVRGPLVEPLRAAPELWEELGEDG